MRRPALVAAALIAAVALGRLLVPVGTNPAGMTLDDLANAKPDEVAAALQDALARIGEDYHERGTRRQRACFESLTGDNLSGLAALLGEAVAQGRGQAVTLESALADIIEGECGALE